MKILQHLKTYQGGFNMTKKLLAVLIGAVLISGLKTQACEHNAEQFICPGDIVISDDNISGKVLGVNPFQNTVAFYHSYSGITYTRPVSTLALGIGCLQGVCVGDIVISDDNISGKVLGVNPFQNTVAFYHSYSGITYTRPLSTLALGLGCIQGVCVGDIVISDDNISGKVIGVNPFQNTVAFYNSYSGNTFTKKVETLSSSQFCEAYKGRSRKIMRYPEIDTKIYLDLNFKFHLHRTIID